MKSLMMLVLVALMVQVTAEEKSKLLVKEYKIPETEMNLEDYHKFHIGEFVKAEGFGESRIVVMPKIVYLAMDKSKYMMTNMRLLSVTDRKKPVIWEMPHIKEDSGAFFNDSISRAMVKNGHMKKRFLNKEELMSMTKLRQGEKRVISKDGEVVKLMAPLHAVSSCIRCHEDYKKGEFMGAFLYSLRKVDGGLFKKEEEGQKEKKQPTDKNTKEVTVLTK